MEEFISIIDHERVLAELKEVAKKRYELIVSQAEEIAELRKVNKNLRQALTPWVMED